MTDSFDVVNAIVRQNACIGTVFFVEYVEGPNWLEDSEEPDLRNRIQLGILQDRRERKTLPIAAREISAGHLRSIVKALVSGHLFGISSRVMFADEREAHIPMMDFKCAPSATNRQLLTGLLQEFCLGHGYLLESGRSYHYYGTKLLDHSEWFRFLGRCLLMTGLSDDRYIGHQLVDGHCVLRLSSGSLRATLPAVVSEFD